MKVLLYHWNMISPINRRYKSVHVSTDNRVLGISKATVKHTCSKLQSINLSNLAQSSKKKKCWNQWNVCIWTMSVAIKMYGKSIQLYMLSTHINTSQIVLEKKHIRHGNFCILSLYTWRLKPLSHVHGCVVINIKVISFYLIS